MRAGLFALLLLAAGSAWADWVKVTEAGETVYYVDPASIGDNDNFRRASILQNYAMPESNGVRSRRVLYEVDCAGDRLRSVSGTAYSESMAQGSILNSWERDSEWLYVSERTGSNIPSRTPYRPIVRYVCSR